MGLPACSLMSACFVVCVMHLVQVHAINDENVLTAMVARLQDTVDRQEQLLKDQQRSTEQLLQTFTTSMVEQQKQLSRLETMLAKENCADLLKKSYQINDVSYVCVPSLKKLAEENASDCADLLKKGHRTSGVYDIYLASLNKKIKVFCDQDTDNGGWTVFQRRRDGSVDFYRDWKTYKEGFGNLSGEFWLGNDYLHAITSQANYTLRVDLTAFDGSTAYAEYSTFAVAAESANYKISLGGYSGTAGEALPYNKGMSFTTYDRDNDRLSGNCATRHRGGWWFNSCGGAYLNGVYRPDGSLRPTYNDGITWSMWLGTRRSLKRTEMKIRP